MHLRLPFLLYSYIAAELLAPFFASLLILYSVFFLVRLMPLLEVVLELQIGLADFIRLFSYICPHMLMYVIPMASMTGVIIAFTRQTNDREIIALKACGVSLKQMLPPVIIIAALIALLTGFFSTRLIPAGEQGMKLLMFQLAKEKVDKGLKEKKFTEALGDLVVYVDDIDDDENWHGVYVSDMRNRQQPIITVAKGGRMSADIDNMVVTIILNDGTLHNVDGQDNQVIRFQRYQLHIPLRPPTRIDGDDVTTLDRGSMTQQQLLESAARLGYDTPKGIVFLSEYHQRLVLPVGCFILSLLGIPLGLQAGPGRRAAGIPLGLGCFVLYYLAFTTGMVLVEDMVVPVITGMWMPNVFFFILTVYVFLRVDKEKTLFPESIHTVILFLYEKLCQPVIALAGAVFHHVVSRRSAHRQTVEAAAPSSMAQVNANATTKIYHFNTCEEYNCPQCTIFFINHKIAEESGFTPCKYCKAQREERNTS